MHQYKVALLEDNKKQLEKLESYLTKIPKVELVLVSTSSDDFFEQLKSKHIEIKRNRLPTDDGSRLCIVNV